MPLENSITIDRVSYETVGAETFAYATKEQRCLNFIIDNILMKFTLAYITGIFFASFLWYAFPAFAAMLFEDSLLAICVAAYMISRVNYAIYYSVSEKCFNGYTVGKLITGTRAIRNDGAELTVKNAIHRSFSRFLPFEFLSGFGERPWHDSWTGTTVIKSR